MIILIIFLALIMLGCFFAILKEDDIEMRGLYSLALILSTLFFTIAFGHYLGIKNPKPEAIDVYRGNTKLEINLSVVDSVITNKDSIVVFK